MIYKLEISEESNLITVTAKGPYSLNEILDLVYFVIKDPRYKPTYNIIIDMRELRYKPIIREIFKLSEFFISSKQYFKGQTGLVTKNKSLYNLFKLATLFVAKYNLNSDIFMNIEEALAWVRDPNSPKI
jgi:hypothetical protein